ncbi:MAG: hypothetical protein SF182_24740 [Deltaproteobacteria bacterium]|nr:hypothetical protein [Deltaproteobacteria bacterium]
MQRAIRLTLIVATALAATAAQATDYPIPGRSASVKTAKLAKFLSQSVFTLPAYTSAADPTLHGAELRIYDTGGSAGDVVFQLPASGWVALGYPLGSRGYRYRGNKASPPDPNCQSVYLGNKVIKGVCKQLGLLLQPPFSGSAAVVVSLPSGPVGVPAGTSAAIRYCTQFGGHVSRNDPRGFKAKDANPPAACAALPPPPATATPSGPTPTGTITPTPANTATPTNTQPTLTPTATAVPGTQECTLASGSKLEINSQAFPLSLNMSGSLLISSTAADVNGNSVTTCDVEQINPINIPSIGYVCVQPASGCANGVQDCNGGTALGVDLRANGNVGACASPTTGNADCAATCASFCAGTGRTYRSSGCTARCSESERVCVNDDDCSSVDEGACNGPDPVDTAQRNICQCQCINTRAGAPGGAGELQCDLGAIINLENGPPCGDGDIKVAIGRTCLPLTTATATTQINNANFSANSVPSSPASNTGTKLSCSALNADASGLKLRGAANFFGSTLGDLAVELFADCQ